jgi:hypothetical protein
MLYVTRLCRSPNIIPKFFTAIQEVFDSVSCKPPVGDEKLKNKASPRFIAW